MKQALLYLLLIFLCFHCDKPSSIELLDDYDIVPENTPFVMGLIEATNDTVHHYPEIVVGYVSEGKLNTDREITNDIPNLFNPTLWTQAVRTFQRFGLSFHGEENALVRIKRVSSKSIESYTTLSHEGDGLYGDIDSRLILEAGKEYILTVELPDGRIYTKSTTIPESVDNSIPDAIELDVEYSPYNDGTPYERSNPHKIFYYDTPKETFLTEVQSNGSRDRETLLLDDGEDFLFDNRGDYLRLGSLYAIYIPESKTDSIRRNWGQDLDKNKELIHHYETKWMRFSFFNKDIGGNFHHMANTFSTKGQDYEIMYDRFIEAFTSRDSTYLFEVSTIEKLGENGEVLPKSENDAIGFFAGYFSVYKKTVLVPVRNFDLDSVLTAHGY